MNSYRIQIRTEGKYFNGIITAQDDVSALRQFEKKMNNGEIEAKDEDFYNKAKHIAEKYYKDTKNPFNNNEKMVHRMWNKTGQGMPKSNERRRIHCNCKYSSGIISS